MFINMSPILDPQFRGGLESPNYNRAQFVFYLFDFVKPVHNWKKKSDLRNLERLTPRIEELFMFRRSSWMYAPRSDEHFGRNELWNHGYHMIFFIETEFRSIYGIHKNNDTMNTFNK